ncbi:hypothetical protein L208DRAFT_1269828, partial [Tricholoma matsutake]
LWKGLNQDIQQALWWEKLNPKVLSWKKVVKAAEHFEVSKCEEHPKRDILVVTIIAPKGFLQKMEGATKIEIKPSNVRDSHLAMEITMHSGVVCVGTPTPGSHVTT